MCCAFCNREARLRGIVGALGRFGTAGRDRRRARRLDELAAFVECIRSRQSPKVGGTEAAEALEIAMKITEQIAQQNARPAA